MSPSPKKHRTIALSSGAIASAVALAALAGACTESPREPLLTYFNPRFGLSIRYPAVWKTQEAEQDGVWYRYFTSPLADGNIPALTTTMLATPLDGSLQDYADVYVADGSITSSGQDRRQEADGYRFDYTTEAGEQRHTLLLLEGQGWAFGLHVQGRADHFETNIERVQDLVGNFRLERSNLYPEPRDEEFDFTLRVPESWPRQRRMGAGDRLLLQHLSPAMGRDNEQGVHASLTLTVEPVDGDIETFYETVRERLGDTVSLVEHEQWHGGYADEHWSESALSASRARRFMRVENGRGYMITCEAREDVQHRVLPWCAMIAETLRIGPMEAS